MSWKSLIAVVFAPWVAIGMAQSASADTAATSNQSVGSVKCSAGRGGGGRAGMITFAALSSSQQGINLLLVEPMGIYTLSLDDQLRVQAASSLDGQTLTPWNLVAYDGRPAQIRPDGSFSLEMMVSTRSFCTFKGTATLLGDVATKLSRPKP